jgi:hypothetical protein
MKYITVERFGGATLGTCDRGCGSGGALVFQPLRHQDIISYQLHTLIVFLNEGIVIAFRFSNTLTVYYFTNLSPPDFFCPGCPETRWIVITFRFNKTLTVYYFTNMFPPDFTRVSQIALFLYVQYFIHYRGIS